MSSPSRSVFASSGPVWERAGDNTLSRRTFAFMVCLWTAAGIALSAIASAVSYDWKLTGGTMILLVIGTLVSSILGSVIAARSANPIISVFGYLLIAVPFGLLLGPLVAQHSSASVVRVFLITTAMTVGLGLIGALWPRSLESWGIWLFGALLVLILGSSVTMIMGAFGLPIRGAMTVWDWIGVAVFSLYVIFDLNRAMRVPATHDNAIDCAVAVYLDFINLFTRLLNLSND